MEYRIVKKNIGYPVKPDPDRISDTSIGGRLLKLMIWRRRGEGRGGETAGTADMEVKARMTYI